MDNNNKKVKDMLTSHEIPKELEPESIKTMLDEKADKIHRKKRNGIIKIVSAAAACAVVCTFGVNIIDKKGQIKTEKIENSQNSVNSIEKTDKIDDYTFTEQPAYMSGASDYSEIYSYFKKTKKNSVVEGIIDSITGNNEKDYTDDSAPYYAEYEETAENAIQSDVFNDSATSSKNYSDTFNQEEGVIEADIVKTDGNHIYYCNNDSEIKIAEVNDGHFTDKSILSPANDLNINLSDYSFAISDMYLINNRLVVVSTFNDYNDYRYSCYDMAYCENGKVYISVYTAGLNPEFLGSYTQDGVYSDIRMIDGYVYIVSNTCSNSFNCIKDADDLDAYIPKYYCNGNEEFIASEDILLPKKKPSDLYQMSYTLIGAVNVLADNPAEKTDIKALANYTGSIYCSNDNLYAASVYNNITSVTRLEISEGTITPSAVGEVNGYVNDQFSMSEYNGYFRIAVTSNIWSEFSETSDDSETFYADTARTYNALYVLDMNMNIVGTVRDFGINETIKSVNFNGDLAYVVTYEQTDPLFAIDLSNPENPAILDEYKINGYSTYMQRWNDSLLLGFGVDADENGIENGIKLVMFDTSDPNELKEAGIMSYKYEGEQDTQNYRFGGHVFSEATWDRKAIYIDNERNIIGIPIEIYEYSNNSSSSTNKYVFYSYDNGQFNYKGEIVFYDLGIDMYDKYNRAIYIDGYIYVMSSSQFKSASAETMETIDELIF